MSVLLAVVVLFCAACVTFIAAFWIAGRMEVKKVEAQARMAEAYAKSKEIQP